ncbi:recombinase family protein [Geomicrobium sp. JCM 19055]|uniref:recombinase family protein n=1 Tax=Geomicrobium sp. JCM 19055 TaxID=1460649 RepID=UPI00045ED8A9|nr:recombinase family protein [Geomicrobium sp. JCM 19055]GAK00919.1 resolvase/integrase Bin [Geomicrobium sp. JCM 19055]
MATTYGYIRVSTVHQDYSLQKENVMQAGVEEENIFSDKKTGKNLDREGFQSLYEKLESGDTIVVTKLDRLGRSMGQIMTLIDKLTDNGIYLVAVKDGIDTRKTDSPYGKAMVGMLALFADVERTLIVERTTEGREHAMKNGVEFGRKKSNTKTYNKAIQEYLETGKNVNKLLAEYDGMTRATFFRRLKEYKEKHGIA